MLDIKNVEEALIESKSLITQYDVKLLLHKKVGDVWPVFDVKNYKDYDDIVILSDYILKREGKAFYTCDVKTVIKYAQEIINYDKTFVK